MPRFAIADTSAAASSLLNGLNAAANQQAQLQRQQQLNQQALDHQAFVDHMDLINRGAVPVDVEKPSTTSTGAHFIDRTQTAAQGAGETITEPASGKRYYVPTQTERDAQSGKTFVPTGGLAEALKNGGAWDGKTPITQEASHSLMMALNEAQPKDEPYDIDVSGKFRDAQGNPVPVAIGKKTKTVTMLNLGGGSQSNGGAPGGPFDSSDDPGQPGQPLQQAAQQPVQPGAAQVGRGLNFAPSEKAEKQPRKEDENDWIRIATDPTSDPQEVARANAALSLQRQMRPATDAQANIAARAKEREQDKAEDASRKRLDAQMKSQGAVAAKHDDLQGREKDQWDLHQRYATLADPTKNPDNSTVFLPSYNSKTGEITDGSPRTMTAALRASFLDNSAQAQRKALDLQTKARAVRKSMGWGEFAPKTTPAQPPRQLRQQPAQPTAAPAAQQNRPAPPASVTKSLAPGLHKFGNGQTWRKAADGSMTYVSGGAQ